MHWRTSLTEHKLAPVSLIPTLAGSQLAAPSRNQQSPKLRQQPQIYGRYLVPPHLITVTTQGCVTHVHSHPELRFCKDMDLSADMACKVTVLPRYCSACCSSCTGPLSRSREMKGCRGGSGLPKVCRCFTLSCQSMHLQATYLFTSGDLLLMQRHWEAQGTLQCDSRKGPDAMAGLPHAGRQACSCTAQSPASHKACSSMSERRLTRA